MCVYVCVQAYMCLCASMYVIFILMGRNKGHDMTDKWLRSVLSVLGMLIKY